MMVRKRLRVSLRKKAALTPRRIAHVYLPVPIETVILVGKEGPKVVRARSRNGLHAGNSILFEGGRVFPEQKHGGGLRKLRMA